MTQLAEFSAARYGKQERRWPHSTGGFARYERSERMSWELEVRGNEWWHCRHVPNSQNKRGSLSCICSALMVELFPDSFTTMSLTNKQIFAWDLWEMQQELPLVAEMNGLRLDSSSLMICQWTHHTNAIPGKVTYTLFGVDACTESRRLTKVATTESYASMGSNHFVTFPFRRGSRQHRTSIHANPGDIVSNL